MNNEFFDKLNDWIRNTESSIVNFISAFAPWLAPLTPAYMTFQHASNPETLNFPSVIAFLAAVLVEILGFSTVSTFLSFWFYNRRNKAESKRAPIEIVVLAFIFYLVLIVSSNVLLDTFTGEKWAEISVRALFTLQTIPAALIVAVRTQHRHLLSEIAKEREENLRNRERQVSEGKSAEQKVSENLPKDWRQLRPTLSEADMANLAALSPEQIRIIAERYKVDVRTVTNWRSYARQELNMES